MIQSSRQNGPISVTQELGVETNHLHREGNLVDDALAGAVVAGEKFKVLDPIVIPLSVDVMDGFLAAEGATNVFFHDVAVFEDFVGAPLSGSRDAETDVSVSSRSAADLAIFQRTGAVYPNLLGCFSALRTASAETPRRHPKFGSPSNGNSDDRYFGSANHARSRLFDAPRFPSARLAAIHGLLTPIFKVGIYFTFRFLECLSAVFTGVINKFFWMHSPSVYRFVGSVARGATINPVFPRLPFEGNAAVGADNIHIHSPSAWNAQAGWVSPQQLSIAIGA